jgi:hypothetical protein
MEAVVGVSRRGRGSLLKWSIVSEESCVDFNEDVFYHKSNKPLNERKRVTNFGTVWLIVGPALDVRRSGRCGSNAGVGFGSVTGDFNPFLGGGQVIVGVPIGLGGGIGSSITKSRVLGDSSIKGFLVTVGNGSCWTSIKFSKAGIGNGRIALYWIFGCLDGGRFLDWLNGNLSHRGKRLCKSSSLNISI